MAERSILNVTGGHVNGGSTGSEVKASLKKEVIPGQCCIPPPFCDYQGLGTEETWNAMPVYITTPKSPASSAVLIISDMYGIKLTRFGWSFCHSQQFISVVLCDCFMSCFAIQCTLAKPSSSVQLRSDCCTWTIFLCQSSYCIRCGFSLV